MFHIGTILQIKGYSSLYRVESEPDSDREIRCISLTDKYESGVPVCTYIGIFDKVLAMYPSLEYMEIHYPELLI